jgi:Ni/Co efflux regulator RcnB
VKHLISAAIVLSLLSSTAAVAQRDYRDNQSQNSDPRQNNGGRFSSEGFNEPHNDRPHWSRGDRLPEQYRQNRYTVSDWKQHNLRTPPRGYRWVSNDNDQYLLAAITTGIILEIVNQNQYRSDYQWSRGDRLPSQYRQNQYIVGDWQQRNLRTPARGYRWIRNNNDQYMMVEIRSGMIIDVVSQNQYRNDYRWSQGDRLSGGYLENRYVVSDWRGNHLRRPARGQHWVHINNQYMLTAIGSGFIIEIGGNGR